MQADAEASKAEINSTIDYYIGLNDDLVEGTDDAAIEANWEAVSQLRDELWEMKTYLADMTTNATTEKAAYEKMLAEQVATDEARMAEDAMWAAEEAAM